MKSQISSKFSQHPLYFGPDPKTDGYRFKDQDGQKCLLIGSAFELVPHVDSDGKHRFKRKLIGKTPGWIADPRSDVSIRARCLKSSQLVRLVGTVKRLQTASAAGAIANSQAVPSEAPEKVETPPAFSQPAATAIETVTQPDTRELRKLARFKRELEIINAQRDIGLDPLVSFATALKLWNRSAASIFRDIKNQAKPAPIKVGNRNFYLFSVVQKSADGLCVEGATLTD